MNFVSLQKWMSLGLGQEIYVMSLKHLVAPESKEVSANKTKQIKQTNRKKKRQLQGFVKETQEPTERALNGQNWNNLRKNIITLFLGYTSNIK